MEFFDKLGKKASEAYKMTADKTGKIAKETKMKLRISELRTKINDIYEEIGKKVYESHVTKDEESIKKEIEEKCIEIDAHSDEIESLLKQCLELKDKKQCPKCYAEIEKNVKFCPNCGEKQTEKQAIEVEIIENPDSKNEKNIKEDTSKDIEEPTNKGEQEKSNLEKTVAIEADVDIEENKEN